MRDRISRVLPARNRLRIRLGCLEGLAASFRRKTRKMAFWNPSTRRRGALVRSPRSRDDLLWIEIDDEG